ncbi:MAG: 2-(1,2-epoxy-1,2-dihydrophenyl)acetyl-CoA isomerase [Candidatus Azotimanducaceae bacterium]|jgi:2-(1,2-epoxy-1,2-dihydrophenyl)acetyl-CoA isomerase
MDLMTQIESSVHLSREAAQVATLTLNRPESLNALTEDMLVLLLDKLRAVEADAEVRAVIITGAGSGFCSGVDLTGGLLQEKAEELEGWIKQYPNPVVAYIRSMSKPVIAAVNGVAAGAGVSLALACDVVLCAQTTRFILSFAKVGLAMDMGASWFLNQRIGPMRAAAWSMSAKSLDAASALHWGLSYEVVPDNELMLRSLEFATEVAGMPEQALAALKSQIKYADTASLSEALDYEARIQGELVVTAETQKRVRAFSK